MEMEIVIIFLFFTVILLAITLMGKESRIKGLEQSLSDTKRVLNSFDHTPTGSVEDRMHFGPTGPVGDVNDE